MKNGELAKIVDLVKEDEKNFKLLYDATYITIYHLAFNKMKNRHDAEDVSQEVYVKISEGIHSLKDTRAFNSWMKRIVHNTCIDALRKRRKKEDMLINDSENNLVEIFAAEDYLDFSPVAMIEQKEVSKTIEKLINRLPSKQKQAVQMYYFQELTTNEIAEKLFCSAKVVRNRLYYARLSLKEKIVELESMAYRNEKQGQLQSEYEQKENRDNYMLWARQPLQCTTIAFSSNLFYLINMYFMLSSNTCLFNRFKSNFFYLKEYALESEKSTRGKYGNHKKDRLCITRIARNIKFWKKSY